MNLPFTQGYPGGNETWQYIAWTLALIEIIVGLYILALNIWNNANRHVGVWLLLTAISTIASGALFTATATEQFISLFTVQVMVAPAVQVGLLLVTAVLLAPQTMRGRAKWLWLAIYAVAFLPALLTVLDTQFGTKLWFTGPLPGQAMGPQVAASDLERGRIAIPLRILNSGLPVVGILLALYSALRKNSPAMLRRLAWLLFTGLLFGTATQFGLRGLLSPTGATVLSSFFFASLFAYIGFQQMVSERGLQRGRLQPRLTLLILAVATPLLIAVSFVLSNVAARELGALTNEQLRLTNSGLKSSVQAWLALNAQSLQEMVSLPDIVSMDPVRQKPILQAVVASRPQLYLAQTDTLDGVNLARSDGGKPQTHSDRQWFQTAKAGQPGLEALISRTTSKPGLNMSMPIRDATGKVIGVGSMSAELNDISTQINANQVRQGLVYVVEAADHIVAHSDPDLLVKNSVLITATQFAPVAYLRQKGPGLVPPFQDENGVTWNAYVDQLDNGWGIIVQQKQSELQAILAGFQNIAWITVLVGVLVLGLLVSLTIRQAIQPVNTLTQTTAAIAAGDLTRTAPIESEDELGTLARAFNSMTAQLRDLIGGLEQRVTDRTADLEKRSRYLAGSTEVGRAAASILDSGQLIREAAELIRERFDLYYVGLFLVDPANEWAVLRAGTGAGGAALLARGHQLKIGAGSMIGWSIANRQPRIAQVAGQDAVRLATPELPETRSEAALPLRSRGQVLGALSVQSAQPNAFDEAAVAVLQIMADQVAVALDNARLFVENQAALEQARRAFGEVSRQAWSELLRARAHVGFRYAGKQIAPVASAWSADMVQAARTGTMAEAQDPQETALAVPIQVRDQVVGVLRFRKDGQAVWTEQEKAMLSAVTEQIGLALESARLYQDTQRRAAQERLVGEVTSRMRESLDMQRVLQTAADEMFQAFGLEEVAIHLAADDMDGKSVAASGSSAA